MIKLAGAGPPDTLAGGRILGMLHISRLLEQSRNVTYPAYQASW